jgi:plasminogen activator inhibitor 1 RNA-binding protein
MKSPSDNSSQDHAKQAGAAWGHESGNAELNDEKAAVADAKAEEAKEGIVSDVTAVDAEGVAAQEVPAEEDNQKSYEQYLAEQLEKKAALAGNFEARKPNEGASKKFPEGKAFERDANENYVAPSAGKAKKQKERKDKNMLDIDQAWKEEQSQSQSQDSGFRGGRGGPRGGSDRPRGGPRGGRGGPRGGAARGGAPRDSAPRPARSSAAPVNVGSSSDFPSLGA